MSVAVRFAVRRSDDAELGSLAMSSIALALTGAIAPTVLFAVRDNVLRSFAKDTSVHALVAAPASLLAAVAGIAVYLALTRSGTVARGYTRQLRLFLPAGILFGLSYTALFEAYYR